MRLSVILPHQLFLELDGVQRIVADTSSGSLGILQHRLDCAAPLVPGIFIYETELEEKYLALGAGILVKTGNEVSIAVSNAIIGTDLKTLRRVVAAQLEQADQQQREVRGALAKLEGNFVRRFLELKHYE